MFGVNGIIPCVVFSSGFFHCNAFQMHPHCVSALLHARVHIYLSSRQLTGIWGSQLVPIVSGARMPDFLHLVSGWLRGKSAS